MAIAPGETAFTDLRRRHQVRRWSVVPWQFARRKPIGAFGAAIILVVIFLGFFAEVVAPRRYDDFNIPERLLGPSFDTPFGTDNQGRDVFSRVIYGSRTTVQIGFGAIIVATVVKTVIGVTSGYFGGRFDILLQRVIDIWMAFPGLIFIIFLVSIMGASTKTLVITLGLLFSAGSSRVVRSATIVIKQNPYVEAAKAIGASDLRIILVHILPNVVPIIIITASVQIGAVILLESSLSFLGYGTPPPFPSWGRMLNEARRDMQDNPHLTVFPGLAIALTVYAFNMFGDALRDVLDPRLRGSR